MNDINIKNTGNQQNISKESSNSEIINDGGTPQKNKERHKQKKKEWFGLSKSNWINLGILIVGIVSLWIIFPSKDLPKPLVQNIQHPDGYVLNDPYPFIAIIRNFGKAPAFKVQPSNIKVYDRVVLEDSIFNSLVIDSTQSFNILPDTEQDITFLSDLIYIESIDWSRVFLVGKLTYFDSDNKPHTTKFAGWFIGNRIIPELNETD